MILRLLVALFLLPVMPLSLWGQQDFRMETEVFQGSAKNPVARHLLLYKDGLFYNFRQSETAEVTILDLKESRLILVNVEKKIKSTVSTKYLENSMASIRTHMSSKVERSDWNSPTRLSVEKKTATEITLSNPSLTYEISGIRPLSEELAEKYRQFSDWHTRINAVQFQIAPFARYQLNDQLAAEGLFPKQIQRVEILPNNQKQIVRSTHLVDYKILSTDSKRISSANNYAASFREMKLSEYLQQK
ncbi:MAG: hypothetical protein MPJ24_00780 [Pirellulaceae bacterium]|nr:hypothetical protein [Pirellulaceae bacterium]